MTENIKYKLYINQIYIYLITIVRVIFNNWRRLSIKVLIITDI